MFQALISLVKNVGFQCADHFQGCSGAYCQSYNQELPLQPERNMPMSNKKSQLDKGKITMHEPLSMLKAQPHKKFPLLLD